MIYCKITHLIVFQSQIFFTNMRLCNRILVLVKYQYGSNEILATTVHSVPIILLLLLSPLGIASTKHSHGNV